MSGWTIVTFRGKESQNYDQCRYNNTDPWKATSDIAATMEEDGRVRNWTIWSGHVYAYLNCQRYDWEFAEELMCEYESMIDDAVVLGANDTTDIGTAKYYPNPNGNWTDNYHETQSEDGCFVGEEALCVINARHGIMARDPFHNKSGSLDDSYLNDGIVQTEVIQ